MWLGLKNAADKNAEIIAGKKAEAKALAETDEGTQASENEAADNEPLDSTETESDSEQDVPTKDTKVRVATKAGWLCAAY